MFISRLSSWGFFFPPIRIDLWRGEGDQMEWMCLGPGLQYVQMSVFTFLPYFHNTSSHTRADKYTPGNIQEYKYTSINNTGSGCD